MRHPTDMRSLATLCLTFLALAGPATAQDEPKSQPLKAKPKQVPKDPRVGLKAGRDDARTHPRAGTGDGERRARLSRRCG